MSLVEQALEKPELFRRIILTAFFFPLILSTGLIAFLVFHLRRRHRSELERKNLVLKQQSLIIEKQQAIERERNRIAGEMHDDLGAGLTRIKYLSERALRKSEDTQETEQIKRIADQSNELVTNMSEIIWAMNSRFDTAENLVGYIRRYASEFLEERSIPLNFHQSLANDELVVTAEKRRNVFLVIKEILHNTVKYSGAKAIDISVSSTSDMFVVDIQEVGAVGFEAESAKEKGNGLFNMEKRMGAVGGNIRFRSEERAMRITLEVPLDSHE